MMILALILTLAAEPNWIWRIEDANGVVMQWQPDYALRFVPRTIYVDGFE